MRCLYCGIRLKIAKQAKVIQHCPECSMRIESETARETLPQAASLKLNAPKSEAVAQARAMSAASPHH